MQFVCHDGKEGDKKFEAQISAKLHFFHLCLQSNF